MPGVHRVLAEQIYPHGEETAARGALRGAAAKDRGPGTDVADRTVQGRLQGSVHGGRHRCDLRQAGREDVTIASRIAAPYPGLRPFRRDETHLFFGRDSCIGAMLPKLAERRFLAVLGWSGTGKSSLVRAGLLPALKMRLVPRAGSRWRIAEFRPGGSPLRNLAAALLSTRGFNGKGPPEAGVERLRERLQNE